MQHTCNMMGCSAAGKTTIAWLNSNQFKVRDP